MSSPVCILHSFSHFLRTQPAPSLALRSPRSCCQILCDGCEEWRIVPDEKWEALGADNLDTWYCQVRVAAAALLLSPSFPLSSASLMLYTQRRLIEQGETRTRGLPGWYA